MVVSERSFGATVVLGGQRGSTATSALVDICTAAQHDRTGK